MDNRSFSARQGARWRSRPRNVGAVLLTASIVVLAAVALERLWLRASHAPDAPAAHGGTYPPRPRTP